MEDQEDNGRQLLPKVITLPHVIFGTSGLGNLFVALDENSKCEIIRECLQVYTGDGNIIFDSAGKYGAGLALEVLGKCLKRLGVSPDKVTISNKLGWLRSELKTKEPTFEPGVWKGLKYDAVQKIGYDGIMECFEQGNKLLGRYIPQMVSVHDPDEYLAAAKDYDDSEKRYQDILDAYEALFDLKRKGVVKAIGVGAKDWRIIRRLTKDVLLDWVMIANSMTIATHPRELLDFMAKLSRQGIAIINAAVFHSGFLVGGDYFDYQIITQGTPEGYALYKWRTEFFSICKLHNVSPAAACIQFGARAPGVDSIALNTTDIKHINENIRLNQAKIPLEFWETLESRKLIQTNFFKKDKNTFAK